MKRPFFSAGPMTALIFLGLLFGLSSLSAQPQTAIVVNDVPIPYEDYRVELVNQLVRSNMPISDTANPDPLLDDGVFLTLVDGELTLQEGKKRGVDLSEEEVIAAILDNPPAFLRGLFEGNFDRGVMRSLLTKPEAIAPYVTDEGASLTRRIAQWKEQVASLKRFYRIQEVTRQLEESLFAAAPLSRHDLEHRYEAARTGLRGSVIRILHSTVPTEEVPVSEQEARTWFTQHIDEYTIPESRLPLTIILPITPSPADSAAQRERLAMIAERIGAASSFAERTAVVDQLEVMLPPSRVPTGSAISPSSFDTEIADELFTAVAGDLVGPFATGGESVYLYVKGTRPSKQTAVRARHILINKSAILYPDEVDQVPEAEAEAAVRQLVTDLADSIATEEDFMRIAFNFSQDVGSGSTCNRRAEAGSRTRSPSTLEEQT